MLARTRTHHIENNPVVNPAKTQSAKQKKSNWRDIFSEELEVQGEQGLYLKGLRLREGYTQAQLGELIDVSPNNISAMEHGRRSIGKTLAKRLARVFNVSYLGFL